MDYARVTQAHAAVHTAQEEVLKAIKLLDLAIAESGLGQRPLARVLGISPSAAADLRQRALTGRRPHRR